MDKEQPKVPERFILKPQKLGQGTFSYIYEAYDSQMGRSVALKMEKKDKSKNILKFEHQVLQHLKGLQHVPNSYDYIVNMEQNFIVMDLLGINLAKARRCLEQRYDLKISIQILIEMVISVKEVHKRGFIHRDVKASNFVLDRENRRVFIVDFGLAKKHLDADGQPVAKRKNADFRGTVSFASLNAHNNIDLARRDDMWSLYFTMLDFLNEKLEWREQRDYTIVQVKDIKTKCLKSPKRKLWVGPTKGVKEVQDILNHIQTLHYADTPDYELVVRLLLQIYNNYDMIQKLIPNSNNNFVWELKKRPFPHCQDLYALDTMMKQSRTSDFQDYFNMHRSSQQVMRLNKPAGLFDTPGPQNNVFEITPNNQGQLGVQPQDQKNRMPGMMQMMPSGQNMMDKQLSNAQMQGNPMHGNIHRQNQMLMQPGNQAMHHQQNMNYPNQKQQVDYNLDLMTGFMMGNSPQIGKPLHPQQNQLMPLDQQQPSHQQMMQQQQYPGQQQNQGPQNGGNPMQNPNNQQQQMSQQQQPTCNVQQFINIQFQQQQQQKHGQPYMGQSQQYGQQQQMKPSSGNGQPQPYGQQPVIGPDGKPLEKQGSNPMMKDFYGNGGQNGQKAPGAMGGGGGSNGNGQLASSQQQAAMFQSQGNGIGGMHQHGGNPGNIVPYGASGLSNDGRRPMIEEFGVGDGQKILPPGSQNQQYGHNTPGMQRMPYDHIVMDKKCDLKRQKGLGNIHSNQVRGAKDNMNKRAKYGDNGVDLQYSGNLPPQIHDQQQLMNSNQNGNMYEMNGAQGGQQSHQMAQMNRNQQQVMNQLRQNQGMVGYQQSQQQMPGSGNKMGQQRGGDMLDHGMKFGNGQGAPEMYMQNNGVNSMGQGAGAHGQMQNAQQQQQYSGHMQGMQAASDCNQNNMMMPMIGGGADQMIPLSQQQQMMRKNNNGNNRRGGPMIGTLGKNQPAAPAGFYCYYPELFDKQNTQIFIITKHPRKQLSDAAANPTAAPVAAASVAAEE